MTDLGEYVCVCVRVRGGGPGPLHVIKTKLIKEMRCFMSNALNIKFHGILCISF